MSELTKTQTAGPSLQTLLAALIRDMKDFDGILFGLSPNNATATSGNDDWLDTPSGSWETGRQSVAVPASHARFLKAIESAIAGAVQTVDIVCMDDLYGHSYQGSKPG